MREWLKKVREKMGLTQHEVAKAAGISQSYYAAVEIGTRNVPVHTAKKIAMTLGFEWTDFYKDAK